MADTSQQQTWHCKKCGLVLAMIERDDSGARLVFDSAMLPSLIRDCAAFVVVECPRCGEERKWFKRGIMSETQEAEYEGQGS
jgi:ribosomal protein S27AE